MKSLKNVLATAVVLMIACQGFAAEGLTIAFDKNNQVIHTVFWSDVPVSVVMEYNYGGACGAIEYYNAEALEYQVGNYHESTTKFWCQAWLEPEGLEPGSIMTFTARAHILGGASGFDTIATVESEDVLLVVPNLTATGSDYEYQVGCDNEWLPDIIDIGQSYCATICHGSFLIPIFCEDPGYTPDLMQITIENGCDLNTECNNSECTGLAQFDDGSGLFQSQVLVFPLCNLFLQISYCGDDEGCICISRGDFYLPVEMNDFDAIAGDSRVNVAWTTASETENDYFELLRDGEKVAEIPATNSATGHSYGWVDNDVTNGVSYEYMLKAVDVSGARQILGSVEATPTETVAPTAYSLVQNYPNPFNSETTFSFSIPVAQHVTLKVYDVLGREIATVLNRTMDANTHTVNWSAENLATGVYLYTLTAGDFSQTNKMLYLK